VSKQFVGRDGFHVERDREPAYRPVTLVFKTPQSMADFRAMLAKVQWVTSPAGPEHETAETLERLLNGLDAA
jgi:hypothetical protein